MPIKFENTQKSFSELVVGKSVAERVDRTIEIAQPIRDVVQQLWDTSLPAEADD